MDFLIEIILTICC